MSCLQKCLVELFCCWQRAWLMNMGCSTSILRYTTSNLHMQNESSSLWWEFVIYNLRAANRCISRNQICWKSRGKKAIKSPVSTSDVLVCPPPPVLLKIIFWPHQCEKLRHYRLVKTYQCKLYAGRINNLHNSRKIPFSICNWTE